MEKKLSNIETHFAKGGFVGISEDLPEKFDNLNKSILDFSYTIENVSWDLETFLMYFGKDYLKKKPLLHNGRKYVLRKKHLR